MTVADAQEFCDQHGINLTLTYEETNSVEEGTIIKQNRTAGVEVFTGANLTLTVAKKPKATPTPTPSSTPSASPTPSSDPEEDS